MLLFNPLSEAPGSLQQCVHLLHTILPNTITHAMQSQNGTQEHAAQKVPIPSDLQPVSDNNQQQRPYCSMRLGSVEFRTSNF
jgi:hypothetical protein